jgi:hypothetical protein
MFMYFDALLLGASSMLRRNRLRASSERPHSRQSSPEVSRSWQRGRMVHVSLASQGVE